LYGWYNDEQKSLIYIPDIYNNKVILTDIRRVCVPIISLINIHNPIWVDYPIFCNIYSLNSVLWFSRYLIKIIHKETNFFRYQYENYKPHKLRDSLKFKNIVRKSYKLLKKNSNQFKNFEKKIRVWSVRRSEMYLARNRLFPNTKKVWKDFWFNKLKGKGRGYRFIKMFYQLKARLFKYFKRHYLGRGRGKIKKKSKTLIYRLGRKSPYKWRTRKYFAGSMYKSKVLMTFLYEQMFIEMKKKRIKGYFFFIKNIKHYKMFKKYVLKLFKEKFFRRLKIKWNRRRFLYRKHKKLKLFFNWIMRGVVRKRKSIIQYTKYVAKHIGSRSQKFFDFYRWEYNRNWFLYTYTKKFKSTSHPMFFYSNVFWSKYYITPVMRQLGLSLWNKPWVFRHNLKNLIFSQKGLTIDANENIGYNTKHLIWTFNFKHFRRNLINYISTVSFKGQLHFLPVKIQRERSLLWSFKHVITNDAIIWSIWNNNLATLIKTISKKFKVLLNIIISKFMKLHTYIKDLVYMFCQQKNWKFNLNQSAVINNTKYIKWTNKVNNSKENKFVNDNKNINNNIKNINNNIKNINNNNKNINNNNKNVNLEKMVNRNARNRRRRERHKLNKSKNNVTNNAD
jgi:hypothetical protein